MSWSFVLVLALGAFACKAVGFFVLARRQIPAAIERCLALIPAAVIAALVAKDTFASRQHLELDPRVLGVGIAIVAVWRRAPFVVVVVLAAAVTAGARQLGWN